MWFLWQARKVMLDHLNYNYKNYPMLRLTSYKSIYTYYIGLFFFT